MPPEDDDTLDLEAGNIQSVIVPPAGTVPAAPAAGAPPAVVVPPAVTPPTPESRARADATAADIRKRERNKILREEYGTDDATEIEKIKDKRKQALDGFNELQAAEEKRKRSEMSEVEQLRTDVAAKDTEIDRLKAEIANLRKDNVAAQQDAKIRSIAMPLFKPARLKYAIQDFREYVGQLTVADQKKLDETRIGAWFKRYVKENPDMAAELGAAPPPAAGTPPARAAADAPPATPPARRTVPAGSLRRPAPAGARPPSAGDLLKGKTPLPGKPNSMNKQELREYARAQGVKL